jgi:hypothetical protein
MSLSSAVEIAVGLVFAYFVFSSICSGVNEGISRVLNLRGAALFKSINALIGDVELARAFWQHELIASLGKSRSKAGSQQSAQASLAAGIEKTPSSSITSSVGRDTRRVLPSYISATTAVTAMRAVVTASPTPASVSTGTAAVAPAHPTSGLQSVLRTVVETARGDEQRIQADLEGWFNDAMDRLSGWYKRYVQIVLLALAIVVTVAFNVNTLHIAQELWRQPALEAVVGQEANQVTQSKGSATSQNQSQSGHESISTAVAQAETLPIGWGSANRPSGGGSWWLTILGWLLTIGALTFGAPFWFDLLTRMNSLRATGPPAKT